MSETLWLPFLFRLIRFGNYELMRWVTQGLGYSYWVGVGACILAIPIGTFVIMNALVFVDNTNEEV